MKGKREGGATAAEGAGRETRERTGGEVGEGEDGGPEGEGGREGDGRGEGKGAGGENGEGSGEEEGARFGESRTTEEQGEAGHADIQVMRVK